MSSSPSIASLTPIGGESADTYVYSPHDPVAFWVGRNIWDTARSMESRLDLEDRRDVLVYTSAALAASSEVTGPVAVTLYASSSAQDTDFTAALVDVFPDGYVQLVREGIRRARFRESEREEKLLEPGQVYRLSIDLGSTSYVFGAGHRIRLEISSSNFDRYNRNLNAGEPLDTGFARREATQSVLHDMSHPSHISLALMGDDTGERAAEFSQS